MHQTKKQEISYKRNTKLENLNNLINHLSSFDWDHVVDCYIVNKAYESSIEIIQNNFERHCPVKKSNPKTFQRNHVRPVVYLTHVKKKQNYYINVFSAKELNEAKQNIKHTQIN